MERKQDISRRWVLTVVGEPAGYRILNNRNPPEAADWSLALQSIWVELIVAHMRACVTYPHMQHIC